jgi:hypothetical protein
VIAAPPIDKRCSVRIIETSEITSIDYTPDLLIHIPQRLMLADINPQANPSQRLTLDKIVEEYGM